MHIAHFVSTVVDIRIHLRHIRKSLCGVRRMEMGCRHERKKNAYIHKYRAFA